MQVSNKRPFRRTFFEMFFTAEFRCMKRSKSEGVNI